MTKVKIQYDTDRQNPYTDWDMFGTLLTKNEYLGGEDFDTAGETGDPFTDFAMWLYNNGHVPYSSAWLDYPDEYSDAQYNRALNRLVKWAEDNVIWQPVYIYSHSGDTINTSPFGCRWDSGQIGYIFVFKEQARKEFGHITKKVYERCQGLLKGTIETLDMYLTGDVYGCIIEDEEGEEIDSCWGFYGRDYAAIAEHFEGVTPEMVEEAFENIQY